jgi:hypothetical protein
MGALAAGCGAPSAAPPPPPGTTSGAPSTTVPPATTSTTTTVAPTTTTDPGLLPQTDQEPSTGAALQAQLQVLWAAIVANSATGALPVFFPRTAYLQMKAGVLGDPDADYTDRLLAFYDLDVAAYHQQLGPGVAGATLVSVGVDPAAAAWIGPGQCENTIGYWHLPGVRLVYQEGTAVVSVAVASLISWRGVWYVVHLGPNPRPSNVGTVDDPESGPGTPGPAGGC